MKTRTAGRLAWVAATASLVFRYRSSDATQRQQLKLIAFAGALVALGAVAFITTGSEGGSGSAARVTQIFLTFALASIPVATGVAILRHGLFDIDRLISRTLGYVTVTAVLASVYTGAVFVLGLVRRPLARGWRLRHRRVRALRGRVVPSRPATRAERRRPALQPRALRRARIVEDFAARLRDEIDLDSLGAELTQVVRRTMQPTHVSLWLRTAPP